MMRPQRSTDTSVLPNAPAMRLNDVGSGSDQGSSNTEGWKDDHPLEESNRVTSLGGEVPQLSGDGYDFDRMEPFEIIEEEVPKELIDQVWWKLMDPVEKDHFMVAVEFLTVKSDWNTLGWKSPNKAWFFTLALRVNRTELIEWAKTDSGFLSLATLALEALGCKIPDDSDSEEEADEEETPEDVWDEDTTTEGDSNEEVTAFFLSSCARFLAPCLACFRNHTDDGSNEQTSDDSDEEVATDDDSDERVATADSEEDVDDTDDTEDDDGMFHVPTQNTAAQSDTAAQETPCRTVEYFAALLDNLANYVDAPLEHWDDVQIALNSLSKLNSYYSDLIREPFENGAMLERFATQWRRDKDEKLKNTRKTNASTASETDSSDAISFGSDRSYENDDDCDKEQKKGKGHMNIPLPPPSLLR